MNLTSNKRPAFRIRTKALLGMLGLAQVSVEEG